MTTDKTWTTQDVIKLLIGLAGLIGVYVALQVQVNVNTNDIRHLQKDKDDIEDDIDLKHEWTVRELEKLQ